MTFTIASLAYQNHSKELIVLISIDSVRQCKCFCMCIVVMDGSVFDITI